MLRFVDLEVLEDEEGLYEDLVFTDKREPPKAKVEVITPPGPMQGELGVITPPGPMESEVISL